jgi:hypothetical protein
MHWNLLAGFIAAHVLAYVAALRHLKIFAAERAIAIYHGLAFAAVFATVVVAFARGTIGFAATCGLLALLTRTVVAGRGKLFPLQMLLRVSRQPSTSREEILASCEAIGADS